MIRDVGPDQAGWMIIKDPSMTTTRKKPQLLKKIKPRNTQSTQKGLETQKKIYASVRFRIHRYQIDQCCRNIESKAVEELGGRN